MLLLFKCFLIFTIARDKIIKDMNAKEVVAKKNQ